MADSTVLNNWYPTEFVDVPAMKSINSVLLSNLFATAKPGTILGIVPTISPSLMTFSTTAGYAFFGVTTNATYIANTGSTTAGCTVEARGAIPLANLNCYIYIKPIFTVSGGLAPLTTISGEVYSSVNSSDIGIKICQVVNGVPTNFNKNNIADYLTSLDNTLALRSPDGSGQNLDVSGSLSVAGVTYLNNDVAISNNVNILGSSTLNNLTVANNLIASGYFGATLDNGTTTTQITNGIGPNLCNFQVSQNSNNNYAQIVAKIEPSSNLAFIQLVAGNSGIAQYAIIVQNQARPSIVGNGVLTRPQGGDITVGYNLPKTAQYSTVDTKGNNWTLTCTTFNGDFISANAIQIYGVCTDFKNLTGGSYSGSIDLFPLGFLSSANTTTRSSLIVNYVLPPPSLSNIWEVVINSGTSRIEFSAAIITPIFGTGLASFQIMYLKA